MRDILTPAAKQITKKRRRKRSWQKVVRTLAMIVVFCTTYALILPAITMQSDAICGMEAHVHIQDCFEEKAVTELICTRSENEEHQHSEECWMDTGETHTERICGKEEHSHSESCYPLDEEEQTLSFHCGFSRHTHHEGCSDENGTLACTIVEHIHEARCAVEDVDMTADVETEDLWAQMAAALTCTGDWSHDLLILAESQMGYGESGRNLVLSGEKLHGYTRYGDWFGNPYMEWDDAFIAFCLNFAKIPESAIPRSSDTDRWLDALKEKGLIQDPAESLPGPGSIVFYKTSDGRLSTAIVRKAENENTDLDQMSYRVIAGDLDGKVDSQVIQLSKITGVCDPSQIQDGGKAAETEPQAGETPLIHTAETENYIVTVTCAEGVTLPQGAQLQVSEYPRDSETYIRRCEEAGYELEWLLNIGFCLNGEELDVEGGFQVEVTSKQGKDLGGDITHFADSGTERLEADAEDGSVSFTSDGFSDFGGGNASRAAATVYNFQTVDVASSWNSPYLSTGVNYVAYVIQNNQIIFLSSNGNNLTPIFVQKPNGADSTGGTWSVAQSQMNTDAANFTWQLVSENGNYYLATQNGSKRLELYNGWCTLGNGTPILFEDKGTGAEIGSRNANNYNQIYELRYADAGDRDYKWRASWYNDSGQLSTPTETVYFAQITSGSGSGSGTTPPAVGYPNYPHAVHTGDININRLRFYNLCEDGEKVVSGLEGCVYEITGPNGYKTTVTSGTSSEVSLPEGMPDGKYTITEISVPEGYIRDSEYERTFIIKNGNISSEDTVGTFINHKTEQIVTSKTAEVEDYANRIYKVALNAYANMREYELEPIDVLFVVDQSNSMLFPSELDDTGKTVTLNLNGSGNAGQMKDLDPSQVYYIIADPTGSSTVWAVWYDGHGWMCQDASYYAKAKHNNEPGYQDDNETVIFPTYGRSYSEQSTYEKNLNSSPKTRSNGGSLDKDLSGSSLGNYISAQGGSYAFTLYTTDNEYNRLHYLEEALANIIYQLADVNGKNRVSLTRFTKVLESCDGPYELADWADYLVNRVTSIKTSGGTRQDRALRHIYEEHLSDNGDHFNKGVDHTYTLLITDGAPVSSDDEYLGGPNSPTTTSNFNKDNKDITIYGHIKGWGSMVRSKSTLMTVGLGMENVQGGKQVLQEIASNDDYFCAVDDASYLLEFVQKLLFENFKAKERINITADIVDDISESFYPIAWVSRGASTGSHQILLSDNTRTWVLLEAGDWITLDGMLTTANASNAAGQLLQREDGTYYVEWNDKVISGGQWQGVVYVKAKEDFIGGNAIDTNKSDATVSVHVNGQDIVRTMKTPTVNVRLLDLNEFHSSVTVYLGDLVNGNGTAPIDALKGFYNETVFTKLISDGSKPLNKVTVGSEGSDGLEDAVFHLRYAMGRDLTAEEWQLLINGETITVPYIYDDASSHGDVGYFTFSLEREGNPTYDEHESHTACQPGGTPSSDECTSPSEVYTLNITYTAYRLGEQGRPQANVNNGSRGPGYEVGTGNRLNNGLGVLDRENIHEVHVISGKIEIWKFFDDGLRDPNARTFTFNLSRIVDGEAVVVDTRTITIPPGADRGSEKITFDNLPRGIYTVTEAEDADYMVKSITVRESTNCESTPPIGASAKELRFVMGSDTQKKNVIGYRSPSDPYTSYISPVNGVYGAATFTNGIKVFEAEIPVEKIWDTQVEDHRDGKIYVLLYLNDSPVVDTEGRARVLMLDETNNWKGSFVVPLADSGDSLANYNYTIREIAEIREIPSQDWNAAILENDGSTLLYYNSVVEEGHLLLLNGSSYVVTYGVGTDGQLTVTNTWAVKLPNTGGIGTEPLYKAGAMLLLAAACFGVYDQRRKHRREAVE